MRIITVPQVRYVGGRSREEAVEEFNVTMMELAALRPRYEREGDGFYIYYDTTLKEPESIVEEHEMNGEYHLCSECSHCVRELNRYGYIDGRKKHGTCGLTGERIRIDGNVCDAFYGG